MDASANPDEMAYRASNPDTHLTYLMAKVEHQLELQLDRALQAEGLTLRQFSALAHIARSPGLSSADLARALLTTPQAVATLIRRLAATDLIERVESARGLAGTIRLTASGLRRLQAAEAIAEVTESRALAGISIADREHVERTLQILLAHLD